jgi:hypothetical protein
LNEEPHLAVPLMRRSADEPATHFSHAASGYEANTLMDRTDRRLTESGAPPAIATVRSRRFAYELTRLFARRAGDD